MPKGDLTIRPVEECCCSSPLCLRCTSECTSPPRPRCNRAALSASPISPDCAAAPPPPVLPSLFTKSFLSRIIPLFRISCRRRRRLALKSPILSLLSSPFCRRSPRRRVACWLDGVPANPSGNGAISQWLGFVTFAKITPEWLTLRPFYTKLHRN